MVALLPWIVLGGCLLLLLALLKFLDDHLPVSESDYGCERVEEGSGGLAAEGALEVGLWLLGA